MRNRAMALVVRNNKILLILTFRFERYIYEIPGGGIEQGETPEQAALRELQEETGLVGEIVRPLNTIHTKDGSTEYVFLVHVPPEQNERIGYDPEISEDEPQAIKDVCWKGIEELSEKFRKKSSTGIMKRDPQCYLTQMECFVAEMQRHFGRLFGDFPVEYDR